MILVWVDSAPRHQLKAETIMGWHLCTYGDYFTIKFSTGPHPQKRLNPMVQLLAVTMTSLGIRLWSPHEHDVIPLWIDSASCDPLRLYNITGVTAVYIRGLLHDPVHYPYHPQQWQNPMHSRHSHQSNDLIMMPVQIWHNPCMVWECS